MADSGHGRNPERPDRRTGPGARRARGALIALAFLLSPIVAAAGQATPSTAAPAGELSTWDTAVIDLPNGAIAAEPTRDRVLVAVSPAVPVLGNHLVELDPHTGTITRSVLVGSDPGALAVSDDGSRAYVGLNGASAVIEVDLASFTVIRPIWLGPSTGSGSRFARSIAVRPGHPESIAVVGYHDYSSPDEDDTVRYEDGIQKPLTAHPSFGGPHRIIWPEDANRLYGHNGDTASGFFYLNVVNTGLVLSAPNYALDGGPENLAYANGEVTIGNGKVVRTSDLAVVADYATWGAVVVDPGQDRTYFLQDGTLISYDSSARGELDRRTVPSIAPRDVPRDLVDTGSTLIAASPSKVLLMGPGVSASGFSLPPAPGTQVRLWGARTLPLDVDDVVVAPDGRHVYGVVGAGAAQLPEHVVEIDTETAQVTRSLLVGSDPTSIAISDDGATLMVGHTGANHLTEVDVASLSMVRTVPLALGSSVLDLAARPGASDTFAALIAPPCCGHPSPAVLVKDGTVLADQGQIHAAGITFATGPNVLFGLGGPDLDVLDVTDSGVVFRETVQKVAKGWQTDMMAAGGYLFTSTGAIVEPDQLVRTGTVAASGQPVPDFGRNRLFMVGTSSITEYELPALTPVKTQAFASGSTRDAVLAGSQLVITTTTGNVVFVPLGPETRLAPEVTSLDPASVSPLGGGLVTLHGSSLTWVTKVTIDGASTPFTVVDDQTITATIPPHPGGTVEVVVTSPLGTGSSGPTFHYVAPPPAITAVAPAGGPTAGTNTVTIAGSGFAFATAVHFGETPATSFTVVSDTKITAVAPAHAGGPVEVSVTTAGGSSDASAPSSYTYNPSPPEVTSVTPASGLRLGGEQVEIRGASFLATTKVVFGSYPAATFEVVSDSLIRATTPSHPYGTVAVQVTNGNGTSADTGPVDRYSFLDPQPILKSVSPDIGATRGGSEVTLSGSWFSGVSSIRFGDVEATSHYLDNDWTLRVTVPRVTVAGDVPITVTTRGGTTQEVVTFHYGYGPVVTSLSTHQGPTIGETPVTLTGTGFTGATAVQFGNGAYASSFQVVSDTQIDATSPPHRAGSVSVMVTNPYATSQPLGSPTVFNYQPVLPAAPTSVAATQAAGRVTVTWKAPTDDGGSSITGYVVTPQVDGVDQAPISVSSTATSQVIDGLPKGVAHAFTVAATTVAGTGPASSPSNAVTPLSPPAAPTAPSASAGNGRALVTWTAPADDGGSPITGFVVTPYVGPTAQPASTFDATLTSRSITGLTNGGTYTFTVAAVNAQGIGPASAPSNPVVPIDHPPVADAGPDQTVAKGEAFTLDASGSSDPDDDPLTYLWEQIGGPVAVIVDPTQKYASVNPVGEDGKLVFRVTVTDSSGLTHTDTVEITVGHPK